jgi:hypothetical protein
MELHREQQLDLNEQPEMSELTFGPFVFRQRGLFGHMRYLPEQAPISGHVLSLDEVEQLHKLTSAILRLSGIEQGER